MGQLEGKVVAVTGASKGIGAAIVKALGAEGAHIIAHYGSDRSGAEDAISDLPAGQAKLIQADFGDPSAVDAFWAEAVAFQGRVDTLVCNAAIMRFKGGIEDDIAVWDEVWDEAVRVNLLAPSRLMREAVKTYLTSGGGQLVVLSSWTTQRGTANPDCIAYAATKAGLTAAAKTIARAYAKDNILTYVVSPGVVRTRMSDEAAETLGGEAAITAGLAMGEWVPPSDIGELVAFLATGKCRHLTGATLDVNGASYLR